MDNTEKQTLVEEGTEFSGTLKSKCKVVVRGAVDGDLHAPAVDITETGQVTGNVKAEYVRSSGVLAGQIDADDIRLAGEVRSNTVIKARSLEVKLTSTEGKLEVTFGDCMLDVGDLPAKEQIDAPSDGDEALDASDEGGRNRRKKKKRGRPESESESETELEAEAGVSMDASGGAPEATSEGDAAVAPAE